MEQLIDKLNEHSLLLQKNKMLEEAKILKDYAIKLTKANERENTLKDFYEFSWHYKGMIDIPMTHYSQKEWTRITLDLRKYSKLAMIEQGLLKKGILSRILELFKSSILKY